MNKFENETGWPVYGIGKKRGCSRSPPSKISLVTIPEGAWLGLEGGMIDNGDADVVKSHNVDRSELHMLILKSRQRRSIYMM
jgi:hypothetical protein